MTKVDWGEWAPKLTGIAILIFCLIFWAFTNRVEPLFVTTGGGLLAIGQGARALGELRRPPEPPPVANTNGAGADSG